ncbi:MAG: YidC/Oxa1 family membrane protein insertase [Candidatus Doudnabacteria bacterium]|nr:YidC/Oxa1 family membrane protein insertase [Candidatus Doudnabacteria bacterium]
MGNIFNNILVHPLLNILVFFYNYIPDIGAVIILLTILVRLLLLPSFHKSMRHQRELQKLQPKMKEIREKYKNDQEQQAKAMMELYKVHKVNPLSSCLPILIQLPLLFALYRVFIQSLNGQALQGLYSFVHNPGNIDPFFLNWINLAAHQNYILAGAAAILQFVQTRMMQNQKKDQSSNSNDTLDATNKMMMSYMMYFLPAMTFFFGVQFPAGLSLYWITTTLFGIAQQHYILRKEAQEVLYGKQ